MARAVWSGALSFGLVALPVQLFTATESHTIRFHQLQRGTSDRVRNRRVNERTGEEVPPEEIVKGYDMGDEYVVVEREELDEIAPGRSRSLEITGFVDLDQVRPVYFDKTYYLAPKGREYGKVYALLLRALTRADKIGIASVVMRNREYLVAVKAEDGVLALHTLHWADEVRDPRREIGDLPDETPVSDKELSAAVRLVEALSVEWDPEDYRDTYREKVLGLVADKRAGRTVEKGEPPPRSTNVIDLMAALQASVEQADAQDGGEPPPARRTTGGGSDGRKRSGGSRGSGGSGGRRGGDRAKSTPRARELEGLSKAQLYRRATEADVAGRSSMNRDQLIHALAERGGRQRAGRAS